MQRPMVFVCHSLGGLVVKCMLIHCHNITSDKVTHLRSPFIPTYGVIFLGTPHNGSNIAKSGSILENIFHAVVPRKLMESNPNLIKPYKGIARP